MNKFRIEKVLGDGTYGCVLRAVNQLSNEVIAIKKMKRKYHTWDECVNLREVKALRKLVHPNIIRLKEVVREQDELFLIFEFMEANLYQLMKSRAKPFDEVFVMNIMFQILQSLAYMHGNGFFHRDIKPENFLVTGDTVKLADFGLAREIRSRPPFTDYVSTRWYRAPEVILRCQNYNSPVDIWACAAVMAELLSFQPLFPGSSEIDQFIKICEVLGSPTSSSWSDGVKQAALLGFRFPTVSIPKTLPLYAQASSTEATKLIADMLQWDPNRRISAATALTYAFFVGKRVNAPRTPAHRLTPALGVIMKPAQQIPAYRPVVSLPSILKSVLPESHILPLSFSSAVARSPPSLALSFKMPEKLHSRKSEESLLDIKKFSSNSPVNNKPPTGGRSIFSKYAAKSIFS